MPTSMAKNLDFVRKIVKTLYDTTRYPETYSNPLKMGSATERKVHTGKN